jgi:hypothetical protein
METETSRSKVTAINMSTSDEKEAALEIEKSTTTVIKKAKISFTLRDVETELREI